MKQIMQETRAPIGTCTPSTSPSLGYQERMASCPRRNREALGPIDSQFLSQILEGSSYSLPCVSGHGVNFVPSLFALPSTVDMMIAETVMVTASHVYVMDPSILHRKTQNICSGKEQLSREYNWRDIFIKILVLGKSSFSSKEIRLTCPARAGFLSAMLTSWRPLEITKITTHRRDRCLGQTIHVGKIVSQNKWGQVQGTITMSVVKRQSSRSKAKFITTWCRVTDNCPLS